LPARHGSEKEKVPEHLVFYDESHRPISPLGRGEGKELEGGGREMGTTVFSRTEATLFFSPRARHEFPKRKEGGGERGTIRGKEGRSS